jgi:hypothetical protein
MLSISIQHGSLVSAKLHYKLDLQRKEFFCLRSAENVKFSSHGRQTTKYVDVG